MARKRERIFAIFVAGLFLITTVGGTGVLIWQMIKDGESSPSATANLDANTTEDTSNSDDPNKLEGKMLDNFTPVDNVDELHYDDIKVGDGAEAAAGSTVTADYTGALATTGKIFQSSLDSGQPFTSALSGLIQGWQEGIPGMKVGGIRRLYIPSDKAYGEASQSGIPANSDLVFDITLHEVK